MAPGHAGILTYYAELKVPSPQTGSSGALTEMWQLLIVQNGSLMLSSWLQEKCISGKVSRVTLGLPSNRYSDLANNWHKL